MNKKIGLMAVLVSLVSVCGSAYVLLQKPALSLPYPLAKVAVPELPRYNQRDLQKFRNHEERLNKELYSQRVDLSDGAMKIFGYHAKALTDEAIAKEKDIYNLAMVYRSGKHHYALIDENLYQRGDVLPDGEVIRNINMSGVVIEKAGNTNLLVVGDVISAPILAQKPSRMTRSRGPDGSFEKAAGAQRQVDAITNALKVLQNSKKALQQR